MKKFIYAGALLAAVLTASRPVAAQGAPSTRNPPAATLLSFVIPGGGQFYTARPGQGAMILLGTGLGVAIAVNANRCANAGVGPTCGKASNSASQGIVGIFTAIGFWGYGVVSAGDDARRYNAEHAKKLGAIVRPGPNGVTQLGLSLAIGR